MLRDVAAVDAFDGRVAVLATAQGGVVSLAQAVALGGTAAAVRSRRETGRWADLHRGVYAVGHLALTARGRAVAALLAGGVTAVLSHQSAAALWGLLDDDLAMPHVTRAGRRTSRRGALTVHGTRDLPGTEIRRRDGLPVTSPERTLIDTAEVAGGAEVARAIREARVKGLVTDESLDAALARHPARHGSATVGSLLRLPEAAPTRSGLERRLLGLVRDAGLAAPRVNHRVAGHECDLVWPEHLLIAEVDAYATHGDRGAFERDRAKDAELTRRGWRVVRVTADQIEHEPLRALATLAALLAVGPAAAG